MTDHQHTAEAQARDVEERLRGAVNSFPAWILCVANDALSPGAIKDDSARLCRDVLQAADLLAAQAAENERLRTEADAREAGQAVALQWWEREAADLRARAEAAEAKSAAQAERIAELEGALEWYACEAEACARYVGDKTKADALVAVVTVMANDGGRRARTAQQKGGVGS